MNMKAELLMSKASYNYLLYTLNGYEDKRMIVSSTEVKTNTGYVRVIIKVVNIQQLWTIARSVGVMAATDSLLSNKS